MTKQSNDFFQIRRQQFLTQDYYEENLSLIKKNIEWLRAQDWSTNENNDEYNSQEARRWFNIAHMTWELLQLEYTAGQPIDSLAPYLEQVVLARENQARAKAEYFKTDQEPVLGDSNEGYLLPLQLIGLSYLLNRRDLLVRIDVLIHGVGESKNLYDDFTYEKLLSFNNPNQIIPDNRFTDDYINLENVFFENNTPKEALIDLTAYLKEWYLLHEDQLWYDSHLDLEHNDKYVGYWSFESAAVVYLLGLDDDSLHRFIYYPADLVSYARHQDQLVTQASSTPNNRYTGRTLCTGDQCVSTGWYIAPHLNSRIEHFELGQVIAGEHFSPQGNLVIWYELTPEAAQMLQDRS